MDELELLTSETPEATEVSSPPHWAPSRQPTPIGPIYGETPYTHVAEGACACTPGLQLLSGSGAGLLNCSSCGRRDPKKVRPVSAGYVYTAEGKDDRGRLALEYRFASDQQLEVDYAKPSAEALKLRAEVEGAKAKRRMQGGYLEIP